MFRQRTPTKWMKIPQSVYCSCTLALLYLTTVTAASQQQLTSSSPNDNFPVAGNYTSLYVEPTASSSCALVRTNFLNRGMDKKDIPSTFLKNNIVLRYCEIPASGTCCTSKMETRITMQAKNQFEKHTKDPIEKLWTVLDTRAKKFDELFKQLLAESKQEFHAMFKRTYGTIYEQNAYVFADLFRELELYYTRGKVNLAETMDSFFNTLYQKLFTVLNIQYHFDDKYMGCVGEHMKHLKPFGDIPNKLSIQVKRSFIATRTYSQALKTAADIVKVMANIRTTAECSSALTKLECGSCGGFVEKPCASYCINVMKGCLKYLLDLDQEWEDFINSMEKISSRLLGPFNVVMVVEPINIKISEAIMNFQEKGHEITTQVFQGCGKPTLGNLKRVNKRDTPNAANPFANKTVTTAPKMTRAKRKRFDNNRAYNNRPHSANENNGKRRNKNNNGNKNGRKQSNACKHHARNKDNSLDRLIVDVCEQLQEHKKFFANLPYKACHGDLTSNSGDQNCWNGRTVDRYTYAVVSATEHNPEVTSKLSNRQNSNISQFLFKFKNAIGNLRNSFNGLDVEWPDQEEQTHDSGSGTGSEEEEDDQTEVEETHHDLATMEKRPFEPELNSNIVIHTTHSADKNFINFSNRPIFTSSTEKVRQMPAASDEDTESDEDEDIDNEITGAHQTAANTNSGTCMGCISIYKALAMYVFPIYVKWVADAF